MLRYRFGDFVLSPRRRTLLRDGVEQPLIPRYFDLLLFLVERRGEAVHRRDIFDHVWNDVIVSDSALSQAIRTIRRALDDDAREVRFVRTVSRHGYEFVFVPVLEEDDVDPARDVVRADTEAAAASPSTEASDPPAAPAPVGKDEVDALLATLTDATADEDQRRDAAHRLHALGAPESLSRLGSRAGHALARAVLRDTRWDSPTPLQVPIMGQPDPFSVACHLIYLRAQAALGLVARRWATASVGGLLAGAIGGATGGVLLTLAPSSTARLTVIPVLAAIGGFAGALGAAGVGAGLAFSEAVTRSRRLPSLVFGGAFGGAVIGLTVQLLSRWTVETLTGLTPRVGGALEGLVIGLAAGLSYAVGTHPSDGLAAPRGRARLRLAILMSAACGLAAMMLALGSRPLVGGTLHAIAQSSAAGGHALLTPLGRLIGEPDFGPLTAALISLGEGATFGFGFAYGLTRR